MVAALTIRNVEKLASVNWAGTEPLSRTLHASSVMEFDGKRIRANFSAVF